MWKTLDHERSSFVDARLADQHSDLLLSARLRTGQGREEGRIDTLRSLLAFKFQTLDARYEARLQAATPEAIDRYLKRLLTADSLAKVFKD